MVRFLTIFFFIGILILIGGYYINRLLKKLRKIFSPTIKNNSSQPYRDNEEILYSKGDIVVMKGEAGGSEKSK